MTLKELHVLIIEDDFRVAEINQQLVEQVEGFYVAAIAKTGQEALAFLEKATLPDLVLLDVFIPDRHGLQLLWEIRGKSKQIGIIILSAANETATVAEALNGGVFDYIVKPPDFGRIESALLRFREQKNLFTSRKTLEQAEIDRLIGVRKAGRTTDEYPEALPKGIDRLTLQDVIATLQEAGEGGINAMEMGKAVGVSRSTARRYLEHLVAAGEAKAQLNYGEIGRPERRYIPWTK
ncbi:response regulator [Planomicrobium sp. YIM 101495]|uniref:response regulator n=1 Tax=Planomicrobium sp. YIM 101495 TaxID=2665160 RepID=UPI0012B847EA|nr:response regulator [Planomicrobium sp. YIM 101495]MTD29481.1 response regulator [Planomicrobium sp. YIM 101495]